jgi:hypothetical protein
MMRVWQRHWTVYTKLYKTSFALNFAEPALYLVAMGFGLGAFVKDIHGQPYIKFIAPGIIASSSMFAAVYECTYGTYIRMTFQKTFDAILATPVNLDDRRSFFGNGPDQTIPQSAPLRPLHGGSQLVARQGHHPLLAEEELAAGAGPSAPEKAHRPGGRGQRHHGLGGVERGAETVPPVQ